MSKNKKINRRKKVIQIMALVLSLLMCLSVMTYVILAILGLM